MSGTHSADMPARWAVALHAVVAATFVHVLGFFFSRHASARGAMLMAAVSPALALPIWMDGGHSAEALAASSIGVNLAVAACLRGWMFEASNDFGAQEIYLALSSVVAASLYGGVGGGDPELLLGFVAVAAAAALYGWSEHHRGKEQRALPPEAAVAAALVITLACGWASLLVTSAGLWPVLATSLVSGTLAVVGAYL